MMIWYQQSTTKTPFFVILSLFVSFLNEKTISKCIIASSSVNFIHNSLLSFFYFLLFWFARWFSGFVVQLLWSSSFLSFSMCVHWLTSFFLFRHCTLISCNVFNCATLQYCMQKTKIKQLKNSLTLFKKWAISCFKEICYQSTDRKPAFAK